jgi:glutathione S-transferase
MELALSDGRPFLLGEAFSLADAYLFVMTTWVTMLGVGDLSKWPKVRYLKQRVEARATVKAALAAETKLRAAA